MTNSILEGLIESLEIAYNEACDEIESVRLVITTLSKTDVAQIVRCYDRVQKAVVKVVGNYVKIAECCGLEMLEHQGSGLLNYVYEILKKAGDCFRHDFKLRPGREKSYINCMYVYGKAIKDRFIDVLRDLAGLSHVTDWGDDVPSFPTRVFVLLEKLSELLPKPDGKFGGRRPEDKEVSTRTIEYVTGEPIFFFLLRKYLDESDVTRLKDCLEGIIDLAMRSLKGPLGGRENARLRPKLQ